MFKCILDPCHILRFIRWVHIVLDLMILHCNWQLKISLFFGHVKDVNQDIHYTFQAQQKVDIHVSKFRYVSVYEWA
jgi:hypothetical protein